MTSNQHNAFPNGRWSRPASPAIKTVERFAPHANNGKGETRLVTYESLVNFKGFVCPACAKPLWRIVGTANIECLSCGSNGFADTIEQALEILTDAVNDERETAKRIKENEMEYEGIYYGFGAARP